MLTSAWITSSLSCKFHQLEIVPIELASDFTCDKMNFRKRMDDLMATLDKKLDSQRDVIDKLQQAFQQAQIKASINQPKS